MTDMTKGRSRSIDLFAAISCRVGLFDSDDGWGAKLPEDSVKVGVLLRVSIEGDESCICCEDALGHCVCCWDGAIPRAWQPLLRDEDPGPGLKELMLLMLPASISPRF